MTTAIPTVKLLTAEEYGRLPSNGQPTELVRGMIVGLNIPYTRHGQICGAISKFLVLYLNRNDIGHLLSNDAAIRTERGPDTVRGADVAFLSYQRRPKGPMPREGYIDEVPELVFEVRSPTDRWSKLLAKVAEFLEAGVKCVCVLDEQTRTTRLYRTEGNEDITLNADQELTFPDILPGFAVTVGQFFD